MIVVNSVEDVDVRKEFSKEENYVKNTIASEVVDVIDAIELKVLKHFAILESSEDSESVKHAKEDVERQITDECIRTIQDKIVERVSQRILSRIDSSVKKSVCTFKDTATEEEKWLR